MTDSMHAAETCSVEELCAVYSLTSGIVILDSSTSNESVMDGGGDRASRSPFRRSSLSTCSAPPSTVVERGNEVATDSSSSGSGKAHCSLSAVVRTSDDEYDDTELESAAALRDNVIPAISTRRSGLSRKCVLFRVLSLQFTIILIMGIGLFHNSSVTSDLQAQQEILIQNNNFLLHLMFGLKEGMQEAEKTTQHGPYRWVIEDSRNATNERSQKGVDIENNEDPWNSTNINATELENIVQFWKSFVKFGKASGSVQAYCKMCDERKPFGIFSWIWGGITSFLGMLGL